MAGIRQLIQKPAVGYSLAAMLIVVAMALTFTSNIGSRKLGPPINNDFYYDLETGELFEAQKGLVPPTLSPVTGKETAVLARVFACNDCADTNDRFVGFLMKHTAEGKRLKEDPKTIPPDLKPMQIGTPDGKTWHDENTPEAIQIMTATNSKCPGGGLKQCHP